MKSDLHSSLIKTINHTPVQLDNNRYTFIHLGCGDKVCKESTIVCCKYFVFFATVSMTGIHLVIYLFLYLCFLYLLLFSAKIWLEQITSKVKFWLISVLVVDVVLLYVFVLSDFNFKQRYIWCLMYVYVSCIMYFNNVKFLRTTPLRWSKTKFR